MPDAVVALAVSACWGAVVVWLAGGQELTILLVAAVVLFEIKIRQEERLMLASFPDEYPAYRRRVPRLVPGLRLPKEAKS